MRFMTGFTLLCFLAGATTAAAADPRLGLERSVPAAKSDAHVGAHQASDGRQGGETIADAVPIPSVPFFDSGATCDNIDDYDEVCPYTGSTSPDVVYSLTPDHATAYSIDLCGSLYDTKLYIYDENLNLVECNDDYYFDYPCGVYVSRIDIASLEGGMTYYIVVDGYGGDCGEYQIEIDSYCGHPCIECPPGSVLENEPELVNEYEDAFNGGCNSPEFNTPFQALWGDGNEELEFCGKTGNYLFDGSNFRDTDWFTAIIGQAGVIEISILSDAPCYLFELWPQNCEEVAAAQLVESGVCDPAEMTVVGDPGELVWLWVGPVAFVAPPGVPYPYVFQYLLTIEGIASDVVAKETTTWSGVKRIYGDR